MKYRAPIRNPHWPLEEPKYWLQHGVYYSPRYNKTVTIPERFHSDGATGAFDIRSMGWQVHDVICAHPFWDDGTKVYPWQAAFVLHDIMHEEGKHFRDIAWGIGTMLFGCRKTWRNLL